MKTSIVLMIVILGLTVQSVALTYYVDGINGNDSNDGTSIATAWKNLYKANAALMPGDSVYIKEATYQKQYIRPLRSGNENNYIVYAAYPGDEPVITESPNKIAIDLENRSFIIIDNIDADGLAPWDESGLVSWVILNAATHNIIQNCEFKYARGWSAINLREGSYYNKILNNRMDFCGILDNGAADDKGDMISIVEGNYNLIEGNYLTRGGHNLLSCEGRYNVIRNNIFDNKWTETTGNRSLELRATGSGGVDGGFSLFENNLIINTKKASDDPKPPSIKVEGRNQIVRKNFFLNNSDQAIQTNANNASKHNIHIMIYHNIIYNNGGAAWYSGSKHAAVIDSNEFKNNLVYKNRQNPYDYKFDNEFYFTLEATGNGDPLPTINCVSNLFVKETPGDASFYIKGIDENSLNWFESNYPENFSNNLEAIPVFINPNPTEKKDFYPHKSSPCIDRAAFLTTTSSAGTGSLIKVENASYFCDGFGIVDADVIQFEGQTDTYRILNVDYENNTLFINGTPTWQSGQGVSLAYLGDAPDIGVYEYDPDNNETSIDLELDKSINSGFNLEQNYPNPFNPTTIIKYKIPEPCDVEIKIYNLKGQQVTTLINHWHVPGMYTAKWDANYDNLANGVYFVRMEANHFIKTHKMTLMQ